VRDGDAWGDLDSEEGPNDKSEVTLTAVMLRKPSNSRSAGAEGVLGSFIRTKKFLHALISEADFNEKLFKTRSTQMREKRKKIIHSGNLQLFILYLSSLCA